MTQFHLTRLAKSHNRAAFDCGSEPLTRYLREQARQDERRKAASCYVAVTGEQQIAGYYTLSATDLLVAELPPETARKLPRYPAMPAVRVGRLAVDLNFRGQGLGAALLSDAYQRAMRSEIAVYALVVDAKDEAAKSFYLHHGFRQFQHIANTLLLELV